MYTIRKKFSFSAAHQLHNLVEDHPCGRLHGHNYEVEVVLSGKLSTEGFVLDYRTLDEFKRYLDTVCDHRNLNDVFPLMQTTAENLAYQFYIWCRRRWSETIGVRVSETPKTWAEYSE